MWSTETSCAPASCVSAAHSTKAIRMENARPETALWRPLSNTPLRGQLVHRYQRRHCRSSPVRREQHAQGWQDSAGAPAPREAAGGAGDTGRRGQDRCCPGDACTESRRQEEGCHGDGADRPRDPPAVVAWFVHEVFDTLHTRRRWWQQVRRRLALRRRLPARARSFTLVCSRRRCLRLLALAAHVFANSL